MMPPPVHDPANARKGAMAACVGAPARLSVATSKPALAKDDAVIVSSCCSPCMNLGAAKRFDQLRTLSGWACAGQLSLMNIQTHPKGTMHSTSGRDGAAREGRAVQGREEFGPGIASASDPEPGGQSDCRCGR